MKKVIWIITIGFLWLTSCQSEKPKEKQQKAEEVEEKWELLFDGDARTFYERMGYETRDENDFYKSWEVIGFP